MLKALLFEGGDKPNAEAFAAAYVKSLPFPDGTPIEQYSISAAKEKDGVWELVVPTEEIRVLIGDALLNANAEESKWFWCMLAEMPEETDGSVKED
jgi:hypothetical protein